MWVEMYETEAANVTPIFGELLISIEHIGSTSIPEMAAKPIIDMMPIVRDIEAVDGLNPALIALGYEPRGEYGIAGRRYFVKREGVIHSHHIHAYQPDTQDVTNHQNFRDYLIAHPRKAQQYAELKRRLSKKFPHDMDGYLDGKAPFIQEILAKAVEWRE